MGCGCGGNRSSNTNGTTRARRPVFRHLYPQGGGYASVDYYDEKAATRAQEKLGGTVEQINPATGKTVA